MLLWLLPSWVFQRRVPWRTEEISELKINLNRALSVLTRNVIIKEIDLFFVLFRSKQVKFAFSALALSYIHQICKRTRYKIALKCIENTLAPRPSARNVPNELFQGTGPRAWKRGFPLFLKHQIHKHGRMSVTSESFLLLILDRVPFIQ